MYKIEPRRALRRRGFIKDNDTYALPGHTMVRPGGNRGGLKAYEAEPLQSEPAERNKL